MVEILELAKLASAINTVRASFPVQAIENSGNEASSGIVSLALIGDWCFLWKLQVSTQYE